MRKSFLLCFVVLSSMFLSGCITTSKPPQVLSETEQYWFVPKGTSFNAVTESGKPPQEVIRPDYDTWCLDAGKLAELTECCNAEVLGITP